MIVFAGSEGRWKYEGAAFEPGGLKPRPRREGADEDGAKGVGVLL